MRRRLLTTYLALLALVLLALEVPLASTVAARGTERLVVDRLLDANRFAAIAEPALRDAEPVELLSALDRYHDLYGITAAVANADGVLVVVAGARSAFAGASVRSHLGRALAGERAGGDRVVWPWQSDPLVLAVPVTDGSEVTGGLRADEMRSWGLAALGGLAALVLFVAMAAALARWILRPVDELDGTTQRVAAGALDARVPADRGPPELRRLARSFNAMADAVADALARQRAFVAQASHQLRNPLTALRIRVDNLEEYVRGAGRAEHRLTLEETDRLARMLDGLLALARAERGRHQVAPVDAAAIADGRVDAWRPLAEQRGITLRRDGVPCAPALAVNTAVDQAIDTLVDNALKFAGPGATVQIDVRLDESTVDIHVVDDGPGLSDGDRRHATERFWRAPDAQNTDGAGLGLPIAVALVAASGGTLRLLAAHPRGLDAHLSFRAAPDAEPGE
jgi:signal transduction histidine kinase